MKVIDFIKALFIPREMKRFRYMSVLFAICLFVLEMYLVLIPSSSYYKRNAHKMVEESDLYYLQSIANIKETEDLSSLVKELQSKKIRSGSENITNSDLAFDELNIKNDEKSIGILSKNKENTDWYFNNKETTILVNGDNKPVITPTDGGIILNNVNTKPIQVEGVKATDKLDLITVTSNDEGFLQINGETCNVRVTSSNPVISIENNNILLDGQYTGKGISSDSKVVYYFVPNTNVYYYEKEYKYTNEAGLVNHILFTINTKATSLNDCVKKYSESEYPNIKDEAYFFVTIGSTFVSYQAHPLEIDKLNIERNGQTLKSATLMVPYSNAGEFTFDGLKVDEFVPYLLGKLEVGYILLATTSLRLQIFIYVIIFTLVVTLLFSLLFKKNGRLKTFKEYYNIASLANIVPAIIAFILMWINPVYVGSIYLFMFAVYYLFVLYRINNSPEIV